MSSEKNYKDIAAELKAKNVKLLAVSKTKPNEAILALHAQGQRRFGENYPQELVEKYESLPKNIEWHLIGSLQSNKVKYIAPFVSMIHSIDSLKLLQEINRQALKHKRKINCLLEFKIGTEAGKHGFTEAEARFMLNSEEFHMLGNVKICGVMGMASFTEDREQVRSEFKELMRIFNSLKTDYFIDKSYFEEISMGMSGDYDMAIEEGSTMVRIGSLLFGAREKVEKPVKAPKPVVEDDDDF